jgi:hypothetical protein
MKPKLTSSLIAISLLFSTILSAQEKDKLAHMREEYAYSLGVQAYIFCYPWAQLSKLEFSWVGMKSDNPEMKPNMSINKWWHARHMITDKYRDGGAPNNDTYYSISWLDVSNEPIILSHGDITDRYFTFEIASFNSDNFAYVGTRTTGTKAGSFAIVGPNWKGELPAGVTKLTTSPTNQVLIFGRTAVKGPADSTNAFKVQDTYKLTPLSLWGKADAVVPENHNVLPPFNPKTDPLADWKTINRAMIKNPPLPQHALLMELYKKVGIGPGLNIDSLDDATKHGLARAVKDGHELLQNMMETGIGYPKVNGWNVPPATMGRAMTNNDFNTIALQCMGGIISHDPEEAIYINTHSDSKGQLLNGNGKYILHFDADQLPDVKYFWSLTMYDLTNNLVHNPINRWSIGSLGGGYKFEKDGSLNLYIQKDSPGKSKESNWLPSAEAGFFVVFRMYGPGPKIVDKTWKMPPLVKDK